MYLLNNNLSILIHVLITIITIGTLLQYSDKRLMKRVKEAMFEIEAKSCIRFVPKEAQDIDYVVIVDAAEECFSAIGRRGGAQITGVSTPSYSEFIECIGRDWMWYGGTLRDIFLVTAQF